MNRWLYLALGLLVAPTLLPAQNTHPADTPRMIQVSIGPTYEDFPEDGGMYCVPTSYTMNLFWLNAMGFTTLAPTYDTNNLAIGENLDRVIAGLMKTGEGPRGGTTGTNEVEGMSLYFKLKGLSGNFSHTDYNAPTYFDFETALISPPNTYQFGVINIGWFKESSTAGTYNYNGGHDVALVDYTSTGTIATINNPEPRSLFNVANVPADAQQAVEVAPVTGTLTGYAGSYLQFVTPKISGTGESLAVLMGLSTWRIEVDPGFVPQTFTMTQNESINTNGGSFSAEADIDDAGNGYGITKTGLGTMTLSGNVTTNGTWFVNNGTLESTLSTDGLAPATPVGTGDIKISGGGNLVLSPALSSASPGNRNVSLLLASGTGSSFTVESGHGQLELNRGLNDSLSVTIGGNTTGSVLNLPLDNRSTLTLKSQDGIAALGGTTKLFVAGSTSNRPPVANGMVFPGIVGQENDVDQSAIFLNYSEVNGFIQATTTTGSDFSSSTDTTIFSTSAPIHVADNGTATVAALIANHNISGGVGSTLQIIPDGAADAGLILNGSSISVDQLSFGNRSGYIYSNAQGGSISSDISTTGSLVTFGPGETSLSGDLASIGGTVYVNSGTLRVSNGGVGNAPIVVQQNAALKVNGTVTGPVTANGGTLLLEGGTISGTLTLDDDATLAGTGTISYQASTALQGNFGSTISSGNLNFEAGSGSPELSVLEGSIFNFTLTSLIGSTPGTDWNFFNFADGLTAVDGFIINLNFTTLTDPETGDPDYWANSQSWNMMYFGGTDVPSLAAITLPEGNLFPTGRFSASLQAAPGGQYLTLQYQAIPEPSTYVLILLGGAFSVFLRARQRKRQ